MKSQLFAKKGNVAGFTKDGKEVVGWFANKSKGWKVGTGSLSLTNSDTQTFATATEADQYALSIIDPAVTEEKRWW